MATKFYSRVNGIKATYFPAFIGAFIMLPFASFVSMPAHNYVRLALYAAVSVGLRFGVYLLVVKSVKDLSAALAGLFKIKPKPIG